MTEDSRWDYRVTIVFKNAAIANDKVDSSTIIKPLYTDQETHKKEEQRRFEILDAHWDLPSKTSTSTRVEEFVPARLSPYQKELAAADSFLQKSLCKVQYFR